MIFSSRRDLNEFLRRARIERDMALTLKEAFGGSQTASRSAMEGTEQVVRSSLSPFGVLPLLGRMGVRAATDRMRNRMATEMSPYLFGQDPLAQLRSVLQQGTPGWPSWLGQTGLPIVGGEQGGR